MKILMVAPEAFFVARGTPLSVYHRIAELESIGHEIDVLTYPIGDAPTGLRARVHRSKGLPFVRGIRPGPSYLKVVYDLLLAFKLPVLLWKGTYDVIYAHEEGAWIAAVVTRWWQIPFIYEMHSSLPNQLVDWKFSNSRIVGALFRRIEQYTIRTARAVVATSPALAAVASHIKPDANIVTIANLYALDAAVSTSRVRELRQVLGLKTDHKVILYAGSFVEVQSLDLLVRAIPAVVAREPNARFVCVGGAEDEIEGLRHLAKEVGVHRYLILELRHPEEDISVFMAAADVLVSPRITGLNAPGKLTCYLNSGRPIVATDCLVHNQVINCDTALLVSPTAEGLAEGILTALEDERLVARITSNARALLEGRYSPLLRMALYEKLLVGIPTVSDVQAWHYGG